jgi:chorismate mutase
MSLEEMRKKIDEVDDKIVRLIAERIRESQSIGDEKKKNNRQVEDAAREEKVLAHIKAIAHEEKLDEKGIQNIYRQIIKSSRGIQGIEVAFQPGPTVKRLLFNISDIRLFPSRAIPSIPFSKLWKMMKPRSGWCRLKTHWKGALSGSMTFY